MTVKELTIKRTKGIIRALRFYYYDDVEVCFNVPRWWFDEQIKDLEHFEHWFNVEAKGYNSVYFKSRQYNPQCYRFIIEGKGEVLYNFFDRYDHICSDLRIYKK